MWLATLSLFSGALLPFAFAPYDWPVMAVISLVLLLMIMSPLSPPKAAIAGYFYGWGYFGHGVYWVYFSIHHFGHAPLWLAIIIMLGMVAILASYIALLGYLLNRFFSRNKAVYTLLAFPSLWVALEMLRGILFTGFPWLSLGYSQIDTWLSGWGAVVGVLGMSWFVALTAGGVLYLFAKLNTGTKVTAVFFIASCWLAGWQLNKIDWTEQAGEPINVALLQGNIPQEIKWLRSFQQTNIDIYTRMTEQQRDADLIVWPETSIPVFFHGVEDTLIATLKQEAATYKSDIIVGLPVMQDEVNGYFNGLHSVQYPDDFYLKRHLVPLGEYMPLKPLSSIILDFLEIPLSDFSAGAKKQRLLQGAGYSFASSICYEDVFQQSSIDGLPSAAYLLNVSNDTWFGDTIAPYQHLQMARMRALESGRYLLRSTNTGLTAIVNQRGEIVRQAPMFKRFVLRGELVPLKGSTPFVRGGWWLIFAFITSLLLVCLWKRDRGTL
ncbi:MAG: apolipoprotein N-acyltransferase [Piscirickettsiaceae bacterium]|nr:MAG: apolipoprotein N-acyltransferase [Piscirickettsiaceae bacterium]